MRKFYAPSLTAKKFLFLMITILSCSFLKAQIDINIGNSTVGNTGTTYPAPLQDWFEGSRAQYLYTAAELSAAGMAPGNIDAIKFNVTGLNTFSGNIQQYTIKIGGSSVSSLLTTAWESGPTDVYGPVDYVPTLGVNTFTFTTPFFWNGTDNIIVEICNGLPGNQTDGITHFTNSVTVPWTTGLSFNGSHTNIADNAGNLCATTATAQSGTATTRPDITFSWIPASTCSGIPAGGNAQSTVTTVCSPTIPFTLSVTGATAASGLTYQWQSSPTGLAGSWTNITVATNSSYTVTPGISSSTYYRRQILCGANNSFSSSVQVTSTAPVYTTLPFTESFEATWVDACSTRDVPNNFWRNSPATGNNSWRRNDDGFGAGTSNAWTNNLGTYTPEASAGTFSARFHTYQSSAGSKGQFDLYVNCNTGTNGKRLSFDFTNSTGNDSLVVLVSINGGASFTRLDSVRLSGAGIWRTKTIVFGSNSATTIIRFEATSDFGTTDIGLDNIQLTTIADCSGTPTGGTASSTATTVCPGVPFTVSVAGATDPTSAFGITAIWQSSPDNSTWTDIAGATGTSYTSAGITATTYFRRRITCGANNAFSTVVTVTLSAAAYATLPFSESFEATWLSICNVNDAPNNFWRGSPVTGNNSWRRQDDGATAVWTVPGTGLYAPVASTGSFSARFHTYFATSGTKGQLNLHINAATASATKRLNFDYINDIGTDSLVVFLSTNGGTSFVRLDSVRNSTFWKTKSIVFTSTSANTIIRFEATSDFSSGATDIGLDNVTVVDFPPCSGMPTGGTTVSSSAIVCPNTGFSLTVSGATDAANIIYQWQVSTNGGTSWSAITGATAISYNSPGITVPSSFRRKITCGTDSSFSTAVAVALNAPTYATLPFAESFENTWINACGIRDVPNNSWRNGVVTGNTSWRRNDDPTSAAWVNPDLGDYNPDASAGIYSARFHSYQASSGTKGQMNLYLNLATASPDKRLSYDFINTSGSDTLSILLSLDGGATFVRLDSARLSTFWRTKTIDFTSNSPTTVIRFEATSDFGVTDIGIDNILVTDFAPCTGVPAAGTTISSSLIVCSEPFTLSLQGSSSGSGLVYQWQTAPSSTGPWADVVGATNFTFTTSQVGTTWYRARVTCTNSNETGTSIPVQVVSPPLVSGTFTINNALPTTIPTNFNNFNDAYNYIKCGINGPVVFNVVNNAAGAPGVYIEQLIMTAVPGASIVNTVSFRGRGSTIRFNSTNTNERAVIKLRGADYIRFDSLKIEAGGGVYGYGVQLISNADSNIVSNCTITTNDIATTTNFAGIVINGSESGVTSTGTVLCDGNQFINNSISGGYLGISLAATLTGANLNNRFVNNTVKDFYIYGMYVTGSSGTIIEGNSFNRPTRAAVTTFNGIYFTGISTKASISKNKISNPFGGILTSTSAAYGIYFTGVDATVDNENIVTNNVVGQFNGQGDQYGFYNASSDNVWYIHNTIALDSATSTSTGVTRGFYQITVAGGILFFNNMVTISRGGAGAKHVVYLATAGTGFVSDYNNYYINAPAGTNFIGFFNAANRATLNDWRAVSSQDNNSLSRNPFYTSPATLDYKPTNGAIDNKGTDAQIAQDILNVPRNVQTPDIGAYEFTAPPCTLPPDAGNTIFNDTTVCQNSPVRLNLTVSAWGATQTFQWQTSPNGLAPWTNMGGLTDDPDTTIVASTSLYYRAAVTCGASTVFSNALQLIVSPALPAGVYTIDKNGTNTYVPGTAGGNFTSFALAKAAMSCGITGGPVVFNVTAGRTPYVEQLRLDSIPGTSAVNTITFNGLGNTLSFTALTVNTERAVLKLSGADHIIFDSLIIDASAGTTYGYGVQLQNNADSNTFRKCIILSSLTSTSTTNYAGVVINASESSATTTGNVFCDSNTFDRNTIIGGAYGITLMGGTTIPTYINNNRFINNTISEFYQYGFYTGGTIGTLFERNIVTRPTRTNTATAVYGVYMTAAQSRNLSISKNRFHRFFGGIPTNTASFYGVYSNSTDAAAGSEVRVTNNLVYKIEGNAPVYGLYNLGSDNVFYYHNTISFDNAAAAATGQTVGLYQTTAATGIFLYNNIFTVTRGGTGAKYGVYMVQTALTEVNANNNDYFVAGTNAHVGFRAGNFTTLAQWQAASSQDAASYALNPLYTDLANDNYRPQLAALDNKGLTTTGVTTDIDNVNRGAAPDLGVYEYAPVPCQTPPVPGTASVTPASGICLESPIHLDITGHSPLGNITFQWQSAASAAGPWTNLSPVQFFPGYDTLTTTNTYYRAAVTCNGNTTYTNVVNVVLNALLVTGTYTINKTIPTNYVGISGANFNSFQDAVTAMNCGVTGPVVFNVASDTYNEQINIPYIRNTNSVNTVTFQSASGNATDVTLTTAATAGLNYTLRLDSTRWFTFRNMSFTGTNAAAGRVIELLDSASHNRFLSNRIISPAVTAIGTNAVGVYAGTFKGINNLVRNNTIQGGSAGVYIAGTSVANLNRGLTVDSNTVSGFHQYGIYTSFVYRVNVNANNVAVADTLASPSYGIYATDADSAYTIRGNSVNFTNTGVTRTVYGIYVNNSDSATGGIRSLLNNNRIASIGTDNKAVLYGLYINNSAGTYAMNNTIALHTTGASSYGLYHNATTWARYYNNTVQSTATSATNNHAAYFNNTATADLSIRNNIFSHRGNGRAMFVTSAQQSLLSDYNMLYTNGPVLVQSTTPAGSWANLAAWRNAGFWDLNSIVYAPAFVSNTDLRPDVNNSDVWAMHGRGIQIAGNNADINGATRPTTLRNPVPGTQTTGGVPDLGAYEFLPVAQPTLLTGTPAVPAPNTTQTFMFGTDSVMKITWGATAPATSGVRRYSGVVPAGLGTLDSMYFYTQVEVPNRDQNNYNIRLHYLDPWQGSIPDQNQIGLGKTIQQGQTSWIVGFPSRVDVSKKVIFQNGLSWIDRFTGLINPYAPPVIPDKDSSNRGRRFWVGYPVNQLNGGGNQDMVLYLSATETANVQVKINGTNWVRNYIVPANTVRVSDIIPKAGVDNAFINQAGLSNRAISITSDVPIVAYSHVYGSTSSGASMLLPVGVWGYEYKTLSITQDYGANSFSYYYAIADNDSTWIEVTSQAGIALQAGNAGVTPGTASIIKLNKGEFYQVVASSQTEELSGSLLRSIPNAQGKCFPIAVFSGSSRTALTVGCGSGGDFMMQQNFPSTAWGKRYLTAPSSASTDPTILETNVYRIAVKDPTTVVRRNGTILTGMQRNFYYEYQSNTADYIESDKPIMVAQFLAGACTGVGDPEMIYISPIEQGIDKVAFYRNTQQLITTNYMTIIVPKGGTGLSSLVITDGATVITPDYTYDHPRFPALYKVVVKRWTSAQQQVRVQSDSAFTGITYGLGSVESYGYNTGTLVKTLRAQGNITNTLSTTGGSNQFTCSGAPFRFTALLPLRATSITFKFSAVPGLSPNADVTLTNPVPNDSTVINGTKYYIFRVPTDYTFSTPGLYPVQINWAHPDIESCDKTAQDIINVQVVPAPNAGFTFAPPVICTGSAVQFTGENLTQNGVVVNQWQWTFHNATTATGVTSSFTYPTAGTFDVKLRSITPDGCLKDSTRTVTVNPRPVVTLVQDSISVCTGTNVTFTVQNPTAGVIYSWYSNQTGGTALATGTSYTVAVTGNATYWVEGVSAIGCNSSTRTRARVFLLGPLATPSVRVLSQDVNSVTFTWDPVSGAASYLVSVRGGAFVPANGSPNLTHTVTGLNPLDTVSIVVRALGVLSCQTSTSPSVVGRTLPDQIYIPNSFSPNGDNLNDRLMVYGYTIKDMTFMVFNQWGEKIFESRNQTTGWDGTAKGKMQPSGVYIYVAKFVLKDGSTVERKGTINLVR